MAAHPSTVEEYDALIAQSQEKTVIVDFSATWCGPCVRIAPVFEQLATETPSIVFIKVDVDQLAGMPDLGDVSGIPMFKVIRNNQTVEKLVGGDFEKLKKLVQKHST